MKMYDWSSKQDDLFWHSSLSSFTLWSLQAVNHSAPSQAIWVWHANFGFRCCLSIDLNALERLLWQLIRKSAFARVPSESLACRISLAASSGASSAASSSERFKSVSSFCCSKWCSSCTDKRPTKTHEAAFSWRMQGINRQQPMIDTIYWFESKSWLPSDSTSES